MPQIATFKFGQARNITLGAGGYNSFLQGAGIEVTRINQDTNESARMDIDDVYNFGKRYDAGVLIAVGYRFPAKKGKYWSAQVVYNKGLVDLHDAWNTSQRNNSLLLSLSFNILNGLAAK